jgi:hypothetical protein
MTSDLAFAAVLSLICVAAPCQAQTARTAQPTTQSKTEPQAMRTSVEDGGSKIDELRVRGQTQQVVVTPKGGGITKSYEIIMNRTGRSPAEGTGGNHSAVGKRVWNVTDF